MVCIYIYTSPMDPMGYAININAFETLLLYVEQNRWSNMYIYTFSIYPLWLKTKHVGIWISSDSPLTRHRPTQKKT